VDVAKEPTFVCALAKLVEEKVNNAKYGIECNGDPSSKIKEISAYLWLIDNSDCEITTALYAAFKRCYADLVGSIYDCDAIGPCVSSTSKDCSQLNVVDINNNPESCILTTIQILQ